MHTKPLAIFFYGPHDDVRYSVVEIEGLGGRDDQEFYYELLNQYDEIVTTGGACFTVPSRTDVLDLLEGAHVSGGGIVGDEHRRSDLRQYESKNRSEVSLPGE